jgi:predicted DNA-binding protein with PD1-like motif
MRAAEGRLGRVFVIRLEDGDRIPDCIEGFAEEKGIATAQVLMIGGIGSGQVVVGPRDSSQMPPDPMLLPIDGAHEVVGVGILAPGDEGKSILHIHASLGRSGQTLTGCLRPGVNTWVVGEIILYEIIGSKAKRIKDSRTGFTLLSTEF